VLFRLEQLSQGAQDLRQYAGAGLAGSTRARSQRGQADLVARHWDHLLSGGMQTTEYRVQANAASARVYPFPSALCSLHCATVADAGGRTEPPAR
jgi:hypothetical protein